MDTVMKPIYLLTLPIGLLPRVLPILTLSVTEFATLLMGWVIAASFLIGFSVGLAATVAAIFHELPQEMGDYGILVYAGSSDVELCCLILW